MKDSSKKSKDINFDLKALGASLSNFFASHAAIIFTVLSLCFLIYSVFIINSIINAPEDDTYRQEIEADGINMRFDTTTIDKINLLKDTTQSKDVVLPNGRINPFSE